MSFLLNGFLNHVEATLLLLARILSSILSLLVHIGGRQMLVVFDELFLGFSHDIGAPNGLSPHQRLIFFWLDLILEFQTPMHGFFDHLLNSPINRRQREARIHVKSGKSFELLILQRNGLEGNVLLIIVDFSLLLILLLLGIVLQVELRILNILRISVVGHSSRDILFVVVGSFAGQPLEVDIVLAGLPS